MDRFAQVFAAVGMLLWLMSVLLDRWAERGRKQETPDLTHTQPLDSLTPRQRPPHPDKMARASKRERVA